MYEFFKGIIGALIGGGIAAYATVTVAQLEFENRAKEVANQARQLDVEMVKISLSILGGEISDKTTASRQFALNALKQYSGVEMIGVDMEQWLAQGSVPEQTLKTIANNTGWNPTFATEREIKELFDQWKSSGDQKIERLDRRP